MVMRVLGRTQDQLTPSSILASFQPQPPSPPQLSQQNKKFLAMAEQATHDPRCAGLDLAAFLLTPIQRLPRYIMLLGRLMKYTDETHADYEQLLRALEVLQQLTIDLDKSFEESAKLVGRSGVISKARAWLLEADRCLAAVFRLKISSSLAKAATSGGCF